MQAAMSSVIHAAMHELHMPHVTHAAKDRRWHSHKDADTAAVDDVGMSIAATNRADDNTGTVNTVTDNGAAIDKRMMQGWLNICVMYKQRSIQLPFV